MQRQSPARLDPVFEALFATPTSGLALAGCLLADGLGTEERLETWVNLLIVELASRWITHAELCTRAWSTSRQEERRARLAERFADEAQSRLWLAWYRLFWFLDLSRIEVSRHRDRDATLPGDTFQFLYPSKTNLPLPERLLHRAAVQQIKKPSGLTTPAIVATSRLFTAGDPLWPLHPLSLSLLHLWPTGRRTAGCRLQGAAMAGASRENLRELFLLEVKRPKLTDIRAWVREQSDATLRSMPAYQRRDSRLALRTSLWSWASDWGIELWPKAIASLCRTWVENHSGFSWAQYITTFQPSDYALERARAWCGEHGLDFEVNWVQQFVFSEYLLLHRSHAREAVALHATNLLPLVSPLSIGIRRTARPQIGPSKAALLAAACRLSLEPTLDPSVFEAALAEHGPLLDPLWPALARHLVRRSTDEDRDLLISLARAPELRGLPLRWGLQYFVRGDVLLEDGDVVTLDELADEAGVPRLAFLDELPEELEVDLDDEGSAKPGTAESH